MVKLSPVAFIFLVVLSSTCRPREASPRTIADILHAGQVTQLQHTNDSSIRTIHVFVALCDNKFQGIVPVPASIGNGQDPKTNLYWGCSNGVKSYFKRSNEWNLMSVEANPSANILERLLFKHRTKDVYLLADAYDGQFIKQATIDFLSASSGKNEIELKDGVKRIFFGGASDLLAYIGHDGLMDFTLQQKFDSGVTKKREFIILACYSKNYFLPHLQSSGAYPLLWTSGLMCPEAYTLHDAIHEWIDDNSRVQIRLAAAKAYSQYQHCTTKAAQNLLVQGW
jgi:hypothetical protein